MELAQRLSTLVGNEVELAAGPVDLAGRLSAKEVGRAQAAELGFPGMTVTGSIGLLAPAGTPTGIIEQIAQASRAAVAEPAFKQLLIDAGIEPTLDSSPEKFRQSLAADVALWTPVVKALGLKID